MRLFSISGAIRRHALTVVSWMSLCWSGGTVAVAAESAPEVEPKIAIIVFKKNSVPRLAEREIEGIFAMERRYWLGNSKITIVQRKPETELYKIFVRRLLPSYASDLMHLYGNRKISVKFVESDAEAIAEVAKDPSAIGYVWNQALKPESNVRSIALIELENPSEGMALARTARLMTTLRGVWDQLLSSLRNPMMPTEDLQLIATAVAEEGANVMQVVPKGNDESTRKFAKMAEDLKQQTALLPEVVTRSRREALRRMATAESTLCMECHRVYRQ